MKKLLYFLIILPLFIFCSCSNDEEEADPTNKEFDTVLVSHVFIKKTNQNKEIAEMGAKVFVYYNVKQTDFHSFTEDHYLGDGVFNNNKESIEPDQIGITDENGTSEITLLYKDKEFTVVIESNIYPYRTSSYYPPLKEYPSYNQPVIKTTYIFNL